MNRLKDYLEQNKTAVIFREVSGFSEKNVKAIKYRVGNSGETFAIVAYPETEQPHDGYPAVLLIHGGDGRSFSEWAKLWASRGYVAIAPDFNAQEIAGGKVLSNPKGGPVGYGSITDFKSENPWAYYSVASATKAIDILVGTKCVNSEKIAVQGISWGGFLSLILCGVDNRIKALSVVYSSAFISDSQWGKDRGIKEFSEEDLKIYDGFIDPQSYLKDINCPVIFSAGCDDGAFTMKNRMKTACAIKSVKAYSFRRHYVHGHVEGWECKEPAIFFESVFGGAGFPEICFELNGSEIIIRNQEVFNKINLIYTSENLNEKDICEWAEIPVCKNAVLPEECLSWFLMGETEEGLIISTKVFFATK